MAKRTKLNPTQKTQRSLEKKRDYAASESAKAQYREGALNKRGAKNRVLAEEADLAAKVTAADAEGRALGLTSEEYEGLMEAMGDGNKPVASNGSPSKSRNTAATPKKGVKRACGDVRRKERDEKNWNEKAR